MNQTKKTMMQNMYIFFLNIAEKFYSNILLLEIYKNIYLRIISINHIGMNII